MNIEVIRMTEDGLSRGVWTFYAATRHSFGLEVRLSEYRLEARATKRHGWKPTAMWPKRRSIHHEAARKCEHPEVDAAMEREVRERIVSSIQFLPYGA